MSHSGSKSVYLEQTLLYSNKKPMLPLWQSFSGAPNVGSSHYVPPKTLLVNRYFYCFRRKSKVY